MIGFTVFILGLFAILFICEIATKVDTSLKVKKLDRQSQQSYKKREQELIEKELLSSLINREIDAQNSLERSVERFRSLPPDVQEKILQRICSFRRRSASSVGRSPLRSAEKPRARRRRRHSANTSKTLTTSTI